MGFLDKLKSMFGGAKAKAEQAMGQGGHRHNQADHGHDHGHDHSHGDHDHDHEAAPTDRRDEQFDLAGFDPDDEEAFFHAVQHMESEGMFGGTDESRAEIMAATASAIAACTGRACATRSTRCSPASTARSRRSRSAR
jgi:ABC-type Zn2+ transport system substrate-binding protein/surface adhesin